MLDARRDACLLDRHGKLLELLLGACGHLVVRGAAVDQLRRLLQHHRVRRDRAGHCLRRLSSAAAESKVDQREVDRRAHRILVEAAPAALCRRRHDEARDQDRQVLVAGEAVRHAVACDKRLHAAALRLAVFHILHLCVMRDQRRGNVGIVDGSAYRRVRDLVADAPARLEAVL